MLTQILICQAKEETMDIKKDEMTDSILKSIKDFILELKEESDRAVVIVGTANIDTLLEKLISGSLLPPLCQDSCHSIKIEL